MKAVLTFAIAIAVVPLGTSVRAQGRETPPINPVVIKTNLYGGSEVFLEVVCDAKATSVLVKLDQSRFLEPRHDSIALDNCAKTADSLEAAAAAVQNDKRFENRLVGTVTITIGTAKLSVVGKDGKSKVEERTVVMLRAGKSGFFEQPVEMNLLPEEAEKLAKALRTAPGIYARLKSAIDFDAIYKAR